jgi:hypothetical protein
VRGAGRRGRLEDVKRPFPRLGVAKVPRWIAKHGLAARPPHPNLLPPPKSGLPDFGTLKLVEIGNSRFRVGKKEHAGKRSAPNR